MRKYYKYYPEQGESLITIDTDIFVNENANPPAMLVENRVSSSDKDGIEKPPVIQ